MSVSVNVGSSVFAPPTAEVGLPAAFTMEDAPSSGQALRLDFPRPSTETESWAPYRFSRTDQPFILPLQPAMGDPVYYFKAIELPPNATLGEFPVDDGTGRLNPDDPDYGVVRVAQDQITTVGMPPNGWRIHVEIYDQAGNFVVFDERVIFTNDNSIICDLTNGDDTTGDGSLANPFQTINGWYQSSANTSTYRNYHVYYRGGTYTVPNFDTSPIGRPQLRWNGNQPEVHKAWYENGTQEVVNWDFSSSQIGAEGNAGHFRDHYQQGINWQNCRPESSMRGISLIGGGGPNTYDGSGSGQRVMFYNATWTNFDATGQDLGNNAGWIWTQGTNALVRHYWCRNRVNVDGMINAANTNCAEMYLSNTRYASDWLGTSTNSTAFGTLKEKAGSCLFFHFGRDARECVNGMRFKPSDGDDSPYSNMPDIGGHVVAYVRCPFFHHAAQVDDPIPPERIEARQIRCTSKRNSDVFRTDENPAGNTNGMDTRVLGCLWITDDSDGIQNSADRVPVNPQSPDGWLLFDLSSNDPTDSDWNLDASNAGLRGQWGYEIYKDIGG